MEQRTDQQNKALHLFLEQMARVLREEGIDMKTALKYSVDVMPTKENLKELVWRPIQKALYGKKSTTELGKGEIDKIWEIINKHFDEYHHVSIPPFPSDEILLAPSEEP